MVCNISRLQSLGRPQIYEFTTGVMFRKMQMFEESHVLENDSHLLIGWLGVRSTVHHYVGAAVRRFLWVLVFLSVATYSQAADRYALVIGNSNYSNAPVLANPTNDAADIAQIFKRLGFDVTQQNDLTSSGMRKALRDFGRKIVGANMAVIFFAGHGMEIDRNNYLIPVDAQLQTDIDAPYEAVSLDLLLTSVRGAHGLRLVILDACRDNPFINSMKQTSAGRSLSRGLTGIEPETGTLVAYAAKEGTVAADGLSGARNSPYTKALLKYLDEPGIDIQFMFRKVRDQVLLDTRQSQEPFTYGSLPGVRITLNNIPTEKKKSVSLLARTNADQDLAYWNAIKNSKDKEILQSYLDQFPDGRFGLLIRKKIASLSSVQNVASQLSDGNDQTESHEKIAALSSNKVQTQEPLFAGGKLVVQIQEELARVGCSPGAADGQWGGKSKSALKKYAARSGFDLQSMEPTQDLVDQLRLEKERVCPVECGSRQYLRDGKCVLKTCKNGYQLNLEGDCLERARLPDNSNKKESVAPRLPKTKKKVSAKKTSRPSGQRCGSCVNRFTRTKAYACRTNGGSYRARGRLLSGQWSCSF